MVYSTTLHSRSPIKLSKIHMYQVNSPRFQRHFFIIGDKQIYSCFVMTLRTHWMRIVETSLSLSNVHRNKKGQQRRVSRAVHFLSRTLTLLASHQRGNVQPDVFETLKLFKVGPVYRTDRLHVHRDRDLAYTI